MQKIKIMVITDPVTAEGFQLTGIDVRPFIDPREAREQIRQAILDRTTEIVVANDNFLEDAGDSVKRHMKSSTPPVIISLPVERTKGRASSTSIQTALKEINMFSREAPHAETPKQEFDHHVTHHQFEARPCTVCGQMMDPGARICASCGSIRRSVRPRGLTKTHARKTSCKVCGSEIAGDKTYCDICLQTMKKRSAKSKDEGSSMAPKPVRGGPLQALVASIKRLLRRIFRRNDRL